MARHDDPGELVHVYRCAHPSKYGGGFTCNNSLPCENPDHANPLQSDATNSMRLCDRCEDESGVSAGADAGDRACSVCGCDHAPHVYVALTEREAR